MKTVHHHIYNKQTLSWHKKPSRQKPIVKLKARVDVEAFKILGLININVQTKELECQGLADTGASVCLAGIKFMMFLGLDLCNLGKCDSDRKFLGANDQKIKIFGVVPILFTDILTGNQTRQMVYICEHESSLLLSYEACVDLKYVSHDFDMYQQKQ